MRKQGFKFGQWMAKAGLLSAGALLPLTASAQTFRLDAENLKNSAGNNIPVGQGLILLVASTAGDNTFSDPVPGNSAFFGGDEVIVGSYNINEDTGVLFVDNQPVNYFGDWSQGDPLAIYWFPNRTSTAGGPTPGEAYGFYTDLAGQYGGTNPFDNGNPIQSDPWISPAPGSPRQNLYFFTSDSVFNGDSPHNGVANLTVVPEPSTYAMVAGLSLLGFAGYRRYRAKTA